MKTSIKFICAVFLSISVISGTIMAQDKSAESGNVNAGSGWAELDAFQDLLNQTIADAQEGNINAVKKAAPELSSLSVQLAKSEYASSHESLEFRLLTGEFTDKTEAFQVFIQQGNSDSEILERLNTLSADFNAIKASRQREDTPKE